MSAEWNERDRLAQQDAEHDVAYAIVNGFMPRADDVDKLRGLYAKRDAFVAATPRRDPGQLEAAHLGEAFTDEPAGGDE